MNLTMHFTPTRLRLVQVIAGALLFSLASSASAAPNFLNRRMAADFGADSQMSGYASGRGAALQANGRLVMVGTVGSCSATTHENVAVARFDAKGGPDASFGSIGTLSLDFDGDCDNGKRVLVNKNGKIIVLAYSQKAAKTTLVQLKPDGSFDTSFGEDRDGDGFRDGKVTVYAGNDGPYLYFDMALQRDGKILFLNSWKLKRYNANGTLDTSFGANGEISTGGIGYQLAVQPDGKILLLGSDGQSGAYILMRYDAKGRPDPNFGSSGRVLINSQQPVKGEMLELLPDGKILVAGKDYIWAESENHIGVARFNADGSLDTTFGSGTGGWVSWDNLPWDGSGVHSYQYATDIMVQPNGKLVLGGVYWDERPNQGGGRWLMVRLNSDGSSDSTFGINGMTDLYWSETGAGFSVDRLLLRPSGQILAAGNGTLDKITSPEIVTRYRALAAAQFDGDRVDTNPAPDMPVNLGLPTSPIKVPTNKDVVFEFTVTGIDPDILVPVNVTGTPSSKYQVNHNGNWTSELGWVKAGDIITVRHRSAPVSKRRRSTELQLGGIHTSDNNNLFVGSQSGLFISETQ